MHILILQCNVGGKTNEKRNLTKQKLDVVVFKKGGWLGEKRKYFQKIIVSSLFIYIYL